MSDHPADLLRQIAVIAGSKDYGCLADRFDILRDVASNTDVSGRPLPLLGRWEPLNLGRLHKHLRVGEKLFKQAASDVAEEDNPGSPDASCSRSANIP